jgi:hypothetical protein
MHPQVYIACQPQRHGFLPAAPATLAAAPTLALRDCKPMMHTAAATGQNGCDVLLVSAGGGTAHGGGIVGPSATAAASGRPSPWSRQGLCINTPQWSPCVDCSSSAPPHTPARPATPAAAVGCAPHAPHAGPPALTAGRLVARQDGHRGGAVIKHYYRSQSAMAAAVPPRPCRSAAARQVACGCARRQQGAAQLPVVVPAPQHLCET